MAAERLFRTGDRAWQMADGNWVYSGRIDDRVKIQGVQGGTGRGGAGFVVDG